MVLSVLLYGSEAWCLREGILNRLRQVKSSTNTPVMLRSFRNRCVRWPTRSNTASHPKACLSASASVLSAVANTAAYYAGTSCTMPCRTTARARACAASTPARLMVSSCWACCPLWTRRACPTMSTLGAVWRPASGACIPGSPPFALAAAAARSTSLRRSAIRGLGVF